MTVHVTCDICGRSCNDYSTVDVTHSGPMTAAMCDEPVHLCHPRGGGDVGCVGNYRAGLIHAKARAEEWLRENEPWRYEVTK